MKNVNIYEAKTNLSKLIEQVQAGKDVVISKSNKPVALLSKFKTVKERKPGKLKGQIKISEDFDQLPDSFMDNFK